MSAALTFVVEEAGCDSCAALVRGALEPLAHVESVVPDHDSDTAEVRVRADTALSEAAVNAALAEASAGAGHTYRVRAGSWRAEPA